MTRGPILSGNTVRLRPIEARDADAMWQALDDPEGMRLTGTTATFTRPQIDQWAADVSDRPGRYDWAMTLPGSGAAGADVMVGEIVVNEMDDDVRSANLRLAVNPGFRRQGLGRQSIKLVLDYVFCGAGDDPGPRLHRLSLDVLSINPSAQALYASLGFQVEGRLRHVYRDGDAWVDATIMSILEDEYRAHQR